MNKPKAREFWIVKDYPMKSAKPESNDYYHVIEYSALTEAQAEIERLFRLIEKAKTEFESIDFNCTCGNNWANEMIQEIEQALTATEEGEK